MKLTFRAFLTEMAIQMQAIKMAKDLVGTVDVRAVPASEVDDALLDRANQEKTERINTGGGTAWMVSVFKAAGKKFAAVYPPKDSQMKPTFYFPVEGPK